MFNNSSGCLAVFLRLFCHFFRSLDSVILGRKAFRHWLSCERSCSYSLCPGLTMCMTFSCNSQIIVFFLFLDTGYLVNATPPTFYPIFVLKFCRCICQALKKCIKFGCIPQINILSYFFAVQTFRLKAWVSCESNSSYSCIRIFWKLCRCFLS